METRTDKSNKKETGYSFTAADGIYWKLQSEPGNINIDLYEFSGDSATKYDNSHTGLKPITTPSIGKSDPPHSHDCHSFFTREVTLPCSGFFVDTVLTTLGH